jgi:hypothetical protein
LSSCIGTCVKSVSDAGLRIGKDFSAFPPPSFFGRFYFLNWKISKAEGEDKKRAKNDRKEKLVKNRETSVLKLF